MFESCLLQRQLHLHTHERKPDALLSQQHRCHVRASGRGMLLQEHHCQLQHAHSTCCIDFNVVRMDESLLREAAQHDLLDGCSCSSADEPRQHVPLLLVTAERRRRKGCVKLLFVLAVE